MNRNTETDNRPQLNGRKLHRHDKTCMKYFNHDITHRLSSTFAPRFFHTLFISLHPFFRFRAPFFRLSPHTQHPFHLSNLLRIFKKALLSLPVKANKMVHQTCSVLCRMHASHYVPIGPVRYDLFFKIRPPNRVMNP